MWSRPDLGPTQTPIQSVPGALSLGLKRLGVKLTTHLQLVMRSRKCESTYPLPHTPSWRNVVFLLLFYFFIIVSGVRLIVSPLGTAATTGPLYQPQMIDDGDCGEIGGMKIGRGNRSTRRKPTPAPLCPPQNPTWQTRSRTPDRNGGKPATNRLSYGAAFLVPFRRLLRLAGSRWRYSTPPPHGFGQRDTKRVTAKTSSW
jgi:hypothetical protein